MLQTLVTVNRDAGGVQLECNVAVDSVDDELMLTLTVNHNSEVRMIEVLVTDGLIDAILDEFPMSSIALFIGERAEREVAKLNAQIDTAAETIREVSARRAIAQSFLAEEG